MEHHFPSSSSPPAAEKSTAATTPAKIVPLDVQRRELAALADAELVARVSRGEERAWEVLVRRYRRLVYAVPNRAGLPPEQVEEVFHETFAKLAERIRSIQRPERIRAWMVTTARRLTIDSIRANARGARRVPDPDAALARIPNPDALPLEELERLESRHIVRQALQRLGAPCRRLLTALFYHAAVQPPSYETVARDLGIPIGSIGPTRARCLKKLLGEYRDLEGE